MAKYCWTSSGAVEYTYLGELLGSIGEYRTSSTVTGPVTWKLEAQSPQWSDQ